MFYSKRPALPLPSWGKPGRFTYRREDLKQVSNASRFTSPGFTRVYPGWLLRGPMMGAVAMGLCKSQAKPGFLHTALRILVLEQKSDFPF